MMRPKRFRLGRNKGTEAPSNFLFFDTESHYRGEQPTSGTTVHSLKLWTAIACRIERGKITREVTAHGTTAEEFWEFHESRQDASRPLWSFAHNLGFDLTLTHFWERLENGRFTIGPVDRGTNPKTGTPRKPWLGRLCLEGRPTFAVVRGRHGFCKFVDTGNYWPTRLSTIGAKFGIPKLSIDFATCTDEELRVYCERDSEICQRAVLDLIHRWCKEKCGVFQMTAASLAMTNWRHTCEFISHKGDSLDIIMEPGHPASALERRGYYGGRVEPFFLGARQEKIYSLDVNSLYLGMMGDNLFPRQRVRKLENCTPRQLEMAMHGYGAIADVCIKDFCNTYPCRPHGVQLHTTGIYHTTLCGPELLRALKSGSVATVSEAWLYSMAPIFRGWAKTWYERKLKATVGPDANEGDAEFAKLVGNSLSGKFGQHGEYWLDTPDEQCLETWGEWPVYDANLEQHIRRRGIAGKCQTRVVGHEPLHSFPAISAYITSHAREYMRSLFALCPPRSIFYTATDSILCNQAAYDALETKQKIHSTNIGELKLKGTYSSLIVHGCNHYQLDDWVIRSGQVGKARVEIPYKPIADIWQGLPSIVARKPNGTVIVAHVAVRGLDPTPKGLRGIDGWVEPFCRTPDPDFGDTPPKKRHSNTPT